MGVIAPSHLAPPMASAATVPENSDVPASRQEAAALEGRLGSIAGGPAGGIDCSRRHLRQGTWRLAGDRNMRRNHISGIAVIIGTLALASCGTEKVLPFDPGGGPPDPDATFTRVQAEIFSQSCALSGCHAGSAPQAGMNLTAGVAYQNTVGVPSTERGDLDRIEPNDPERSYMIKKVRGDSDIVGARMPLGGALTADEIKLLTDWVRRGAPND